MSTTDLALRDQSLDVDELGRIAKMLALSGFFKTTGDPNVAIAQMAVKVLAGREMGFGPFASATGIEIIQGRPAVGANLIAAAIKSNPRYDYRIATPDGRDHLECTLEFFENGKPVGKVRYTIDEAKAAGLLTKENWKNYPSDMLFARCISRGKRRFAPDVFNGNAVYTPEELGSDIDGETGELLLAPQGREGDGPPPKAPPRAPSGREVPFMQPETEAPPEDELPAAFSRVAASAQDEDIPDALRVNLDELGETVHGRLWAQKRKAYAEKVSGGRTSFVRDLSDDEIKQISAKLSAWLTDKQKSPAQVTASTALN